MSGRRSDQGERFSIGCVSLWQGGWAGNSGAEQGEEEEESEMESGKGAVERLCVWRPRGSV